MLQCRYYCIQPFLAGASIIFIPEAQRSTGFSPGYGLPVCGLFPIQESVYQLDNFISLQETICLELRENQFHLNQNIKAGKIPRKPRELKPKQIL
jgi:hypothetical protein